VRNKKHGIQQEKHLLNTVCLFITIASARAAIFVAGLRRCRSTTKFLHFAKLAAF
jgi:hypothetical protein